MPLKPRARNHSVSGLRLWPGVAGAIILVAARFVIAPFVPGGGLIGLLVSTSVDRRRAAGGMLFMLLLPATVPPFLVAGAILSRRSSRGVRWARMAVPIVVGSGVWVLARTDGKQGANPQLAWR